MNRWMVLPFLAYDVVSSSSLISACGLLIPFFAALLTDMSSERGARFDLLPGSTSTSGTIEASSDRLEGRHLCIAQFLP